MNNSTRFHVYSLPDTGPGEYLGAINQTLRVVEVASGLERHKHALQYLIDQHPTQLLIIPSGEHRKSKTTTLAKIAPNLVLSYRRNNTKKRPTHTYLQGTRFLKKRGPANKDLQTSEKPFFENPSPPEKAIRSGASGES